MPATASKNPEQGQQAREKTEAVHGSFALVKKHVALAVRALQKSSEGGERRTQEKRPLDASTRSSYTSGD